MKKKSSTSSAVATKASASSTNGSLTMFTIKASKKKPDGTWSSQPLGVAFQNVSEKGQVSYRLKFDPYVRVPVGDPDVVITMFPIERK